jgi:putative peptidoglycan lipid II flippase
VKETNAQSSQSSTARSTSIVMAATSLSRVLGFVRQAVINAIFGASGIADVLNTVFTIPNNLRKLLAEGALSSAFIPVLSQVQHEQPAIEHDPPREIVRNLLTLQYLILVPLLVLSVVFSGPVSRIFLDFEEPERLLLGAELFRWFVHYALLVSVSAVLIGTLNSCDRFTAPAITPIVFSVCVITSILLLHRRLGMHAMSVGILLGGLGQILFQVPQFRRLGFDFRPSFGFRNPYFRQILRRWAPVVAASGVFAINQYVAFRFATGLADGSSSALANAIVFWQLPLGVFGVSVMTVLFPRMSREAGIDDTESLRHTVGLGIRSITALLIPSAVVLSLLGREIIAVAFQRGNFNAANTEMAARVLWAYCTGMLGVSAFNFLQRFHYARSDYRTPTLTAVGVLVVDVGLSLWLKETALGVAGLAIANSIAFTLGAGVLAISAARGLGGLEGRENALVLGKTILATAPVTALLILVRLFWGTWWVDGSIPGNWLRLLAVGMLVAVLTVAMYLLLRMEVVQLFLRRRTR